MRFRKTHVGDIIKIDKIAYEVKKIYPHHIQVENIATNEKETFTFGDLVVAGIKSGQP